MNLHEILATFSCEQDYHNYLIEKRWPDGVKCPFCYGKSISHRHSSHRLKCNSCNKSFSATAGTVLHATRLPLSKWFLAVSMIVNAKKGISSLQLARTIGVNKNTAWYMQMRLRKAMMEDYSIDGFIEFDKNLFPSKLNLAVQNRKQKSKKSMLLGLKDIEYLDMKRGEDGMFGAVTTRGAVLRIEPLYCDRIKSKTQKIRPRIHEFFRSWIVENDKRKHKRSGSLQVCAVSGFLSTLKRAVLGQFHQVNPYNLFAYVEEVNYKFNHRREDLFELTINRCLHYGAVP